MTKSDKMSTGRSEYTVLPSVRPRLTKDANDKALWRRRGRAPNVHLRQQHKLSCETLKNKMTMEEAKLEQSRQTFVVGKMNYIDSEKDVTGHYERDFGGCFLASRHKDCCSIEPVDKRTIVTNKRQKTCGQKLVQNSNNILIFIVCFFSFIASLAHHVQADGAMGSTSLISADQSTSRLSSPIRASLLLADQSAGGVLRNTHLSSPIRTSPFGLPKKEQKNTAIDFLVNKNLEQNNNLDASQNAVKNDGSRDSKSALRKSKEDNLSKYYKKKLRRQKQEERLYDKIRKFVIRECKQDYDNRLQATHFLRSRSLKAKSSSSNNNNSKISGNGGQSDSGGSSSGRSERSDRRSKNNDNKSSSSSSSSSSSRKRAAAASARAVRRHVRKRHKISTALQCDFKLKQVMHQLKRGKLVYMYSLAAYPDRYLRLFHTDVRNCYLASTLSAASANGAANGMNNEIQTKDQRVEVPRQHWQQQQQQQQHWQRQYHEIIMGQKATKLLQRCLERKIRHKATSLTELGRLLVDLRSIFIGLCSGSFRKCNQDFGVLVEAPIRNLYQKFGRKTRLLGEQIRDIILGCGRSPDFYHCTYASLKEYSAVYKRRKK